MSQKFITMLHELKVGNKHALRKWTEILEAEWVDNDFKVAPGYFELKNFSTALSHEINQPLTFIKIIFEATIRDINNESINSRELATDCNEALEQIQRITIFLDRLRSLGKNHSK